MLFLVTVYFLFLLLSPTSVAQSLLNQNNSFYCNTDGFMAYRSKDMAVDILMHLAKNVDEEWTKPAWYCTVLFLSN